MQVLKRLKTTPSQGKMYLTDMADAEQFFASSNSSYFSKSITSSETELFSRRGMSDPFAETAAADGTEGCDEKFSEVKGRSRC